MPLLAVQADARSRFAGGALSKTNLSIYPGVFRRGEVFQPRRLPVEVVSDSIVVFADDEPEKNWSHDCRYLFYDPGSGQLTRVVEAKLPPSLGAGDGHVFEAFHEPSSFTRSSVIWPNWRLPVGLYLEPVPQWYAILFAGNSNNRHVNDLEFLYRTLVDYYLVPKANITVLNFDGTLDYNLDPHPVAKWPGDNTSYRMPINGKGTKTDLAKAIDAVGKKLGPKDNLLIHTNNHGYQSGGVSYIVGYGGDDYSATAFAAKIKSLPKFNCLMIMMEQCNSGGFITPVMNATTADCTSIATAAHADNSSSGGPEWDPFALAWIEAMAQSGPDGSTLPHEPDTNDSGAVSASEAYVYAETYNGSSDTPLYEATVCGSACSLAADRPYIPIPVHWRHLFPWQILPDPGPEQIQQIRESLSRLLGAESPARGELAALLQRHDAEARAFFEQNVIRTTR